MTIPPILLLGFGKMGQALAAGWHQQGLASAWAIDPAARDAHGVRCVADSGALPADFRPLCVVLAVKPQMAAAALPALAHLQGDPLFLSIMAGCTIARITGLLGGAARVVRAMPNTPAAIGRGITVVCAGPGVDRAAQDLCTTLLAAAGSVHWTGSEADLDAVTAISGSGPAYVFLLAELLQRAAEDLGLSPMLARALARETVAGSGALMIESQQEAAELRRAVTSPGGTTAAALAVLQRDWPATLGQAVRAAADRARELSG